MNRTNSANPYLHAMGITQWVVREAREHQPSADPVVEKLHRSDLHDPRKAAHQMMADLLNDSPQKPANKPERAAIRPTVLTPAAEKLVMPKPQDVKPAVLESAAPQKTKVPVTANIEPGEHSIATCERCSGVDSSSPSSPRQSDWLVIGEPVGKEKNFGIPAFEGASEILLNNMLSAVGVKPNLTNIWNLCADFRPASCAESTEPKVCLGCLNRQIALVRPKVVLLVGRFAVDALLSAKGTLRGRIHYSDRLAALANIPIVVTYHPAYLLGRPADKAKCWVDLKLALAAVPVV